LKGLEGLQNQTARFTWGTVPCVHSIARSGGDYEPGGFDQTQETEIVIRESVIDATGDFYFADSTKVTADDASFSVDITPNTIKIGEYVEIDRVDLLRPSRIVTDAYTVTNILFNPGGGKFDVTLAYIETR
jgi:hypothetical protein